MLEMPRRSVTRFFIPLIDVLTLLFCIFLMMPAVKKTAEASVVPNEVLQKLANREQKANDRDAKLAAKERELRQEIGRLRRDAMDSVLKQLPTRVLEVDAADGRLYYYDPDRKEIKSAEAAHTLIELDRSRAGPGRAINYVIQRPRDPRSEYPKKEQLAEYTKWFREIGIGLSLDSPFSLDAL